MKATARLRRDLARLVAGPRTEAATEEAARLVAEFEAARAEEATRAARPVRVVSEAERVAAERAEEARKWRKTLTAIGRGRGAASTVIWRPGRW